MWAAATYEEGGATTYPCRFSRPNVQHAIKAWTDTVDRLWALRRQHWEETSKLIASHRHYQHQHPQQGQHSHPHHQQLHDHDSQDQHQYKHQYQHEYQPTLLHGNICIPRSSTNHSWPHHDMSGDSLYGLKNANPQPCGYCKPRRQGGPPAFATSQASPAAKRSFAKEQADGQTVKLARGTEQDIKEHDPARSSKRTTETSSGGSADVLRVPMGLVSETNSKLLKNMVNKNVDSYIKKLRQPSSMTQHDYKHFKHPTIIHAGSLYHFKPQNLGRGDFEEWMKKHRQKKASRSSCGTNVAFGRSITLQRRNSAFVTSKDDAKNANSAFIKCLRGKLSEYEQEKKERQRKMAEFKKRVAIERKSVQLNLGYRSSLCKN